MAKWLLCIYGLLLVSSWSYQAWWQKDAPPPEEDQREIAVASEARSGAVLIRYRDIGREGDVEKPTVLLLHGSPVASAVFDDLEPHLSREIRWIIPDLPGFGRSTRCIDDYSIEAHAKDMWGLLDALSAKNVHLVGYSMGAGVALEMIDERAGDVASLTLFSGLGAQEYELLGDYALNRALHGMQLFALWALDRFTPHFGWMDRAVINYPYARNFMDTDQRPLREIMTRWDGPALVVHGKRDFLVPVEAAREHGRLMPQAEVVIESRAGHLMIFQQARRSAELLENFILRAARGEAATRAQAGPIEGRPVRWDRNEWLMATLLGLATFASEDLACIGAGLLASKGAISLGAAIAGCFAGIFVGDFAIYLLGRLAGPTAIRLPILRRALTEKSVKRYAAWFERRGVLLVVSTRFVPGSRVPTYFAAGVVKVGCIRFGLALFIASAIWTPAIVGLTFALGGTFLDFFAAREGWVLIGLLISMALMLWTARILGGLLTWRGRRLLLGRWRRLSRWEFWPAWLLYLPAGFYIAWLMIRYRSLTVFTAANPCMPASGFVYESKSQILSHLQKHGVPVGRFAVARAGDAADERCAKARRFMERNGLEFPLVAKPDLGERGQGVLIAKGWGELEAYLRSQKGDAIVQEFLPGREFGVFYCRLPGEERGRVLAVTDKRFTSVVGDGESTLEWLILHDRRAVCMGRFFLEAHQDRLDEVPAMGEERVLAEIGTHCRGSLFLDGERLMTPELQAAIDEMTRPVAGFYFGRYDLRTPTEEDLAAGRGLRVIELNGVTSEATSMYDPRHSVFEAWRTIFKLWRLAFEIGRRNEKAGVKPTPALKLMRLILRYLRGKPPEA